MKAYLMRLICAAILCALIDALAGSGGGMRRLTAGIFLTLVAFSVPTQWELPELDPRRFYDEARAAVSVGEEQAVEARYSLIMEGCEAYVLSKAEALGLDVSVRIILDDGLKPARVELTGTASQVERQKLTALLTGELGMGEEDVIWTDGHQSGA